MKKTTLPTASREEIVQMHILGMTYTAISMKTGVRRSTVEDICRNPSQQHDSGRQVTPLFDPREGVAATIAKIQANIAKVAARNREDLANANLERLEKKS